MNIELFFFLSYNSSKDLPPNTHTTFGSWELSCLSQRVQEVQKFNFRDLGIESTPPICCTWYRSTYNKISHVNVNYLQM